MFSEAIDEVCTAIGRISKRTDVARYMTATIRECQNQAYFFRDFYEDAIDHGGADPYNWTFNEWFRTLRTAQYPNFGYVKNMPPGRIQEDVTEYYYAGPTYVTFKGAGTETQINVGYYKYLERLNYYAVGARPAVYDYMTAAWTYLLDGVYVPSLGSDELDEAARNLVSNWLLFLWRETIIEGTLAKAMLAVDDPRAQKHYAVFQVMKKSILQGETFESLNT